VPGQRVVVEGVKGDRGQPKITIRAPKTHGFVHFMLKNRRNAVFQSKVINKINSKNVF
jgi:hypothetical protein